MLCHTGSHEKCQVWSSRVGVREKLSTEPLLGFLRKRQDREGQAILDLVILNNSCGLKGIAVVSGCLVPGSGMTYSRRKY